MRRCLCTLAFAAATAAAPVPAAAANFIDRIFDYAEDTLIRPLDAVRRDPDGTPPFRVALMLPGDGALAEAAERVVRGWRIAIGMSDGYVVDRPVEIVLGETAGGPEQAAASAREIMERNPVDIFAGVIGARTAHALFDVTRDAGRPLVLAGAIGEKVLAGQCHPHVARTSFSVGPYQTASGRFIASKHSSLVTFAPDSPGSYTVVRRFTNAYRAAGGKIVEQVWAPPGRKYDWSSWLARSAQRGPKAIYAFFQGRNAERIVYAHSDIGLKHQVPLIGPEWLFGPRAVNRRGVHAAGARFLTSHLPTRATAANRVFVEAYRDAHGEDPDVYAYMGYENALAVLLTAAELGGTVRDATEFVAAMRAVDYKGLMPRGPFVFNGVNSAVLTRLFWVELRRDDGDVRMRELAMIPVDMDDARCGGESG